MPELAEVKIMSDYINKVSQNITFHKIEVSEKVKHRLNIVTPSDFLEFKVSSISRGKELLILCNSDNFSYSISCSMGMSGFWLLTKSSNLPKHSHLRFHSNTGMTLSLVDARRFARWKWNAGFSKDRGPDPVNEYELFVSKIKDDFNLKEFDKPIHLVLMNQKYFNGIGNYLRAEILYKSNQNPFVSAREAISKNSNILKLCKKLPQEAYVLGGGQLKDWNSPFDVPKGGFKEWLKCYGRLSSIVDKYGRTFWFDNKWSNPKS